MLTWHQQQFIRREYRTRNKPAHIKRDSKTSICGVKHPEVYLGYLDNGLSAEVVNNPENLTCKECKRIWESTESN